jgi:hypothetical protein
MPKNITINNGPNIHVQSWGNVGWGVGGGGVSSLRYMVSTIRDRKQKHLGGREPRRGGMRQQPEMTHTRRAHSSPVGENGEQWED